MTLQGELVSTTTSDAVRLEGLYCPAKQIPRISIDAAVVSHGLAGNFYSSRLLLHFSQTLLNLGISVVVANNRGHDHVNATVQGGRVVTMGAAHERVSDCQFDIAAWCDFLVQRRHTDLMLLGHSLGAIKSLYAQAHLPNTHVRAVVGLSATRLNYEKFMQCPRAKNFKNWLVSSESLIAEGRGQELMNVDFPFATWITAEAYREKYGPHDKYDWMRFFDRIRVPTLLLFGEKELKENPAFDGIGDELPQLQVGWNSLTIEVVPGADHFYSARFDIASDMIVRWLTRK
jgi:pimeloyl-ACP methyl ester carboxylesterase